MFAEIRSRGGNRDHPTCKQFGAAFCNVHIDALVAVSEVGNCEEDVVNMLDGLESLKGDCITSPSETAVRKTICE